MFSSIVRDGDLERFAQQPDSKLPRFSYVGPILHRGCTTCLLGTVCTVCTARMHALLLHFSYTSFLTVGFSNFFMIGKRFDLFI